MPQGFLLTGEDLKRWSGLLATFFCAAETPGLVFGYTMSGDRYPMSISSVTPCHSTASAPYCFPARLSAVLWTYPRAFVYAAPSPRDALLASFPSKHWLKFSGLSLNILPSVKLFWENWSYFSLCAYNSICKNAIHNCFITL